MGFIFWPIFKIAELTMLAMVKVLNGINVVVPDDITESIEYFAGFMLYFQGVFPVRSLMGAIIFVISVFLAKYAFVLFGSLLFPLIPLVGRSIRLPKVR